MKFDTTMMRRAGEIYQQIAPDISPEMARIVLADNERRLNYPESFEIDDNNLPRREAFANVLSTEGLTLLGMVHPDEHDRIMEELPTQVNPIGRLVFVREGLRTAVRTGSLEETCLDLAEQFFTVAREAWPDHE